MKCLLYIAQSPCIWHLYEVLCLCQKGISFEHLSKRETIKRSLSYDDSHSASKWHKSVETEFKQLSPFANAQTTGMRLL